MKRIDIDISQRDIEQVINITQDTHLVIKVIGEWTISKHLSITPEINGVTVNVDVMGFLENNSDVNLELVFRHKRDVTGFNYLLNGKIILIDESKCKILPVLEIGDSKSEANHKLVMGGIDYRTRDFMLSKGLSLSDIQELIKSEMVDF